jgi:hypothetical protein
MADKQLVPFSFEAKAVVPFEKEVKPLASLPPDLILSRCSRLVIHVHHHNLKKARRRCMLSRMITVVKQLRRSQSVFLATWI